MTPKYIFMTPKYIFHLICRPKILFTVSLFIIILLYMQVNFFSRKPIGDSQEPIDVVYTWVNGSDPYFLKSLEDSLCMNIYCTEDSSRQRFDDKNGLKFSLRSLEKYAPWIHHVYIITNGQIPYWLNLDFEGVTIIEHEQIFPNLSDLPTFSSLAIETHLNRIPGISKKFIYLNDDVFFGENVNAKDFYLEKYGFWVYLGYLLPPCSKNCPWKLVNNGHCDHQCYNKACQMDGNDCKQEEKNNKTNYHNSSLYKHQINVKVSPYLPHNVSNKLFNLKSSNLSQLNQEHNKELIKRSKLRHKKPSTYLQRVKKIRHKIDTHALAMIYTNRILNEMYGYKPRYSPLHAPIMIDTEIMESYQEKFAKELRKTSASKFRTGESIQFAFSYYYFLMYETNKFDIGKVFDRFDVDRSGTWSDKEIRKILKRLKGLTFNYPVVKQFKLMLMNCILNVSVPEVSTPEFERYFDSKLPTISKYLVTNCPKLKNFLLEQFGTKLKYSCNIISEGVTFIMLKSNITKIIGQLDQIRKKPSKFICINDDVEGDDKINDQVTSILYDFYLKMFPHPSKYELPVEIRNSFLYMSELKASKRFYFQMKLLLLIIFLGLFSIFTYLMYSKGVLVRLVNKIFK